MSLTAHRERVVGQSGYVLDSLFRSVMAASIRSSLWSVVRLVSPSLLLSLFLQHKKMQQAPTTQAPTTAPIITPMEDIMLLTHSGPLECLHSSGTGAITLVMRPNRSKYLAGDTRHHIFTAAQSAFSPLMTTI